MESDIELVEKERKSFVISQLIIREEQISRKSCSCRLWNRIGKRFVGSTSDGKRIYQYSLRCSCGNYKRKQEILPRSLKYFA